MKILAIDSTAKAASVALSDNKKILSCFSVDNGNTHTQNLLPMVANVLAKNGLTVDDIDIFASTEGPGSFTGVRIGSAVLKGLAFGRSKPCIGISTLEAIAYSLYPIEGIYCPVMDARRNQVYNAIFSCENGIFKRLTDDRTITLPELHAEVTEKYSDKRLMIAGDGYDITLKHFNDCGYNVEKTPPILINENAACVAMLAYDLIENGKAISAHITTDTEFAPTYLRKSQAEREREEKIKKDEV